MQAVAELFVPAAMGDSGDLGQRFSGNQKWPRRYYVDIRNKSKAVPEFCVTWGGAGAA